MMSKDALPSLDASLPRVLADLEGLGIEGLGRQWRNHLGGEAPTHLPRWLFLRVLGHHLQTAAFGDIDKATRRMIQKAKGALALLLSGAIRRRGKGSDLRPARSWFASGKESSSA